MNGVVHLNVAIAGYGMGGATEINDTDNTPRVDSCRHAHSAAFVSEIYQSRLELVPR